MNDIDISKIDLDNDGGSTAPNDVDGFSSNEGGESGWPWPTSGTEDKPEDDTPSDAINSDRLPDVDGHDEPEDIGTAGDVISGGSNEDDDENNNEEDDATYDKPSFLRRRFHRKKKN